MILQNKII